MTNFLQLVCITGVQLYRCSVYRKYTHYLLKLYFSRPSHYYRSVKMFIYPRCVQK